MYENHEGREEAERDGCDTSRDDDFYGSNLGNADNRYVFAVGGVCAAAKHARNSRSDTVAHEGAVKTGVFQKVSMDNAAEVEVVADVFANGYQRNGSKCKHDGDELTPLEGAVVKVKECKAVVTDKAGNADVFEVVDDGREVDDFRIVPFRQITDSREKESGEIACAHTDNERNKGKGLLAVVCGERRNDECHDTAKDIQKVISTCVCAREVVYCRACKPKTDNHDNGAYDDGGKELKQPTRTRLFDNECNGAVDETDDNHTDC